jgi:hypothetical protein
MTATNHVITGAILVAAIKNPVVALPLALASHFVLDYLPHFGDKTGLTKRTTNRFKVMIGIDINPNHALANW